MSPSRSTGRRGFWRCRRDPTNCSRCFPGVSGKLLYTGRAGAFRKSDTSQGSTKLSYLSVPVRGDFLGRLVLVVSPSLVQVIALVTDCR